MNIRENQIYILRLQYESNIRKYHDLSHFTIKPQENRNKPKVMGFNNKSRMTTPFRHVDIMADLNEEVTEDSDESEGNDGDESEGDDGDESGGDDDSDNEDFEESSEEEILSDSMDEDNDKGKSNRRKDKKNKVIIHFDHVRSL